MFVAVSATLAVFGAASPVAPTPQEALSAAATLCESSVSSGNVTLPAGAQLFSGAAAVGSVKPLSAAPELIHRFAATQSAGRTFGTGSFVRLPSGEGEVWAVDYNGPACDVMATGLASSTALATGFAAALPAGGWSLIRSVDASPTQPLAGQLWVKRSPKADAPAHGTRLRMQWLTGVAARPDGVQIEASYLAGDIALPPTQNQ